MRICERVIQFTLSRPTTTALKPQHVDWIAKRYAGHSKWANIKHQKAATDLERNKTFNKLIRLIKVAISQSNDPNPETNSKLQSVLGQCKRANMPAGTITNAIKTATASKSDEKISTIQIRGPGRCAVLVEIATANTTHVKNLITSIMKKHGCKFENVNFDFSEKGILIASPLATSTNALDDATEHAIEAGVEEVKVDEETKKLQFECSPEITFKAKKALEELGYIIDSAVVEFIPQNWAELSDEQLDVVSKFYEKLEGLQEVVKITDNIA